jgi:hypothetical protein
VASSGVSILLLLDTTSASEVSIVFFHSQGGKDEVVLEELAVGLVRGLLGDRYVGDVSAIADVYEGGRL